MKRSLNKEGGAMETFIWPSNPPNGCPFEPSKKVKGITFMGRHAEYTDADTWYPSWAMDGNMYSPWTDGRIGEASCWSMNLVFLLDKIIRKDANKRLIELIKDFDSGKFPSTGQAKITGDDPTSLKIVNLGIHSGSADPYRGRYPCGSLFHNDVWYYGTYCLDESERGLNWDILGPFVGFRVSMDFGKTWTETPHTPRKPIFGETGKEGAKVKIGAPHFVDFGKNMEHSPDAKAYLVGHGAVRPDANLSWISGDQIYLIRVTPSVENINDRSKYEFFAGHNAQGKPIWSSDFQEIKPLVQWDNHCGCVTATYNAPLKKYLMCITDGWPTIETMNTFILESDEITGPWKLVTFMERFGEQGYFVNIPSKFISDNGKSAWLCYSANFTDSYLGTKWESKPAGSRYAMCLHQIEFVM
jgi:hypothetical protein